MSLLKNITEENFKQFVLESFSKAEVIKKCGLKPAGSNYSAFDQLIKKWNVDDSHFAGQSHLKGKSHDWNNTKIELKDILVEYSTYNSNRLRKRLLSENILSHKCSNCELEEWLGNKIPLELEHKNGNKFDHRLENLELRCPNCHALTSTYRGKNKKISSVQT